jgi:MFS family permease
MLAFKRLAVVVLAPVSGHASDRFGERTVTAAGFAITAMGALIIGFGGVIAGALLISCGAAVLSTAIPISAAVRDPVQRVAALARTGMARDCGAAAGTLAALGLFDAASLSITYSIGGMLLVALWIWLAAFADVTRRATATPVIARDSRR